MRGISQMYSPLVWVHLKKKPTFTRTVDVQLQRIALIFNIFSYAWKAKCSIGSTLKPVCSQIVMSAGLKHLIRESVRPIL